MQLLALLPLLALTSASIFDFLNNQHGQPAPQFDLEQHFLENPCNKYICPDTLVCAASPKECPCPFPSSSLRCVLPNKEYVCVSKPAGDFDGKYDDPATNWKVDAKDNTVRDCGWVKRAWSGEI